MGNDQWVHWFSQNTPDVNHLTIDMAPSVSEFSVEDLCNTELYASDGSPIRFYSAENKQVVAKHFEWMARHGIDGAAVQRFVGPLADYQNRQRSDQVLRNARAGAEAAGRVFFITYDVSGADSQTVVNDIKSDWQHLVDDLKLTDSASYLHVNGKPVLELWGFGFTDRPGSPGEIAALISDLKGGYQGLKAAALIGGVPTNWRTLDSDSKTDPSWAEVYRSYDVISPWSVGRFSDDAGIDNFIRDRVLPDLAETKSLGIGYMPVIFPGFSWYNLQKSLGAVNGESLNQIPRRCGNFLWHQVFSLLNANVDMLYAAMFDEVDEGTALFPTVTQKDKLPQGSDMVFLNQEGCDLPDDWYLRVTGRAATFLRNQVVPPQRLDEVLTTSASLTLELWHSWFAVDARETPLVGDFNGDGKADIMTLSRDNPNAVGDMYVALSDGIQFGAGAKWNDWFAIDQDETAVIGDFNGDHVADIATWLGKTTKQVYVATSYGTGMNASQVWLNSIGENDDDVIKAADVDGDGYCDIVVFSRHSGKVYVAVSSGSGFNAPTVWHDFFAVSTYEKPETGDLDGDGKADIITFCTDSPTARGSVYVALSDGSKFGDNQKWNDWFAVDPSEKVRINDLDGDGLGDLVTFLASPFDQVYAAYSEGSGMSENYLIASGFFGTSTDQPFLGDVNGDGKADLILFRQGEGKVYVGFPR
jgi:hypothetical protein